MFRTEVVKSKNLRKTIFFKIYNVLAFLIFLFIISMMLKIWGEDSTINTFITENYTSIVQPVIMGLALVLFLFSMWVRNAAKSPQRLGSIELDENELKYLENDELVETISLENVDNIEFEFFSFRMKGNPMGCMNYLSLNNRSGSKNYEIVIPNTMVKAEFGELLSRINKQTPVKIKFSYFLKQVFGDSDFKFEK
ncbi:MAG: hypothetical protein PF541_15450 [Prolixibacteraceae bacterium]|jgi:hypothetical protein|nr:hypothetical protein [Prolixibacteraceae bacterium]